MGRPSRAIYSSELYTGPDSLLLSRDSFENDLDNLVSLNKESFEHELSVTSESLRLLLIAILAGAVIIVAFGFYFGLWTLSNMAY